MGKSLGIVFIVLGGILLFILLSLLFNGGNAISINNNSEVSSFSIKDLFSSFFTSNFQCNVFIIGVSLILLYPVLGLLTAGFRLIFHPNLQLKWMRTINSLVFITGLLCCIVSGALLIREFSASGSVIEQVKLSKVIDDTLHIAIQPGSEINLKRSLKMGRWNFYFNDEEQYLNGRIQLTIAQSEDMRFLITGEKNARGQDNKQAIFYANALNYFCRQKGNTVFFNPYFKMKKCLWRNQQVSLNVFVPEGKFISFESGTEQLINTINTTQTMENSELMNQTFQMTNEGLDCVTCEKENK